MTCSRAQQTSNINDIRAKSLEVALYSTNPTGTDVGTEITGGGYVRRAIALTAPTTVSDGVYTSNDALISFPTASGDYSAAVSHYGVREIAGPLQFYGPLQELGVDTTRTVRTGDTFRIAVNTLIHKEQD